MTSKTKQEDSETMEDVINSMKHACELARNLESELPNMANQPHMLSLSIDNVVQAFSVAKERLFMMMMSSQQDQTITTSTFFVPMLSHDAMQQAQMGATTSMQEWHQLFQMQQPFDVRTLIENKIMIGGVDLQQLRYNRSTLDIGEMGGRDMEGSARSNGSEGDVKKIEASSSSPRPRKSSRKNDPEKKIEMVPAPLVGNTEMPPEDGYTWRKYGQKEILGSKHPRSYYRCTHQKLYACPAKKQVQKLDHNPNIFEVTYRGEHICHKSSTAPSFHPPARTQSTISTQVSPSSTSVSGWLSSVNLSLSGGGGLAPTGAGAGASSSADPSTSKYGTEYLVADMADVMFNSGSSSGNSMETLFPSQEDKWEPSEKKR